MPGKFSAEKPIYAQLVERLQMRIVTGGYPPGSRLSAVRELAEEAGVNPNTMQRALSELEVRGLLYTLRTSGRFVTEDADRIARVREELAREKIGRFLSEMEELGIQRSAVKALLEKEESTNE